MRLIIDDANLSEIERLYDLYILAASFKNARQVQELCRCGVDAATVSPAVIDALMKNACVEDAVEKFISDFEGLCGAGVTMLGG